MGRASYFRYESEIDLDMPAPTFLSNNPLSQYNYFISIYNRPYNKVNGIPLHEVEISSTFRSLYPFQSKKSYILRLLVPNLALFFLLWVAAHTMSFAVVILGVGVAMLSILYSAFISLCIFKGYSVMQMNEDLVENPLANMIYSPKLCAKQDTMAAYFKIKSQGKLFDSPPSLLNLFSRYLYKWFWSQ